MTDRYIIAGRSPTSGRLMYYTTQQTFATRGHSLKFASIEKAFEKARKLLAAHPQLRGYHLFAEKLSRIQGSKTPVKNPGARGTESGYRRAAEGYARELDKAADAYEAFTGAAATHVTAYKKSASRRGFALGKLLAVEYRATRDGETNNFRHDFKKSSQPLLIGSDDGSCLDIVGGRIRVTERGIEDT